MNLLPRAFGGLIAVLVFAPAAWADISVAGSSTVLPIVRDVAPLFEQATGIRVRVSGGGSDMGVVSATNGVADIGMVSRRLSSVESAKLTVRPIASDGIAVIVNRRNSVERLIASQVRGAFSKRIDSWSELGWPEGGEIIPVIKSAGRSTRQLFDEHFGIGNAIPQGFHEVGANVAMMVLVAADPQAIGYVGIGSLDDGIRRGLRIKGVAINGHLPTIENCRSGRYALCRPLLLVTRDPARRDIARFLDFMASPEAIEAVRKRGFEPVGAQP